MSQTLQVPSKSPPKWRDRLRRVVYFFPLRLFILHLKKNHFLLFFWVLLFGFTTNLIAPKYGVSYLFLYPEYLGENSLISFAITGFALGGFITAFNLYTYILHGFRFPFIATLDRPFQKFSINNFLIPLVYIVTYMSYSASFQLNHELESSQDVFFHLCGFLSGLIAFLFLSHIYFNFTNKNAQHYSADKPEDPRNVQTTIHKKYDWSEMEQKTSDWQVVTYLRTPFSIRFARSAQHYHRDVLEKAMSQNHVNASIFELVVVFSFLLIGLMRGFEVINIPAAASAMLFFTVLLMVVSAIFSWIKGWTWTVFILAFLALNFSWETISIFNSDTKAYGLSYDNYRNTYDDNFLRQLSANDSQHRTDSLAMVGILNAWKRKNQAIQGLEKPKLTLISTSGGGLRASLWTFEVMHAIDSLSKNQLLDKTHLITGSSGGMIGAAYYRDLTLKAERNTAVEREGIGKDLLNPIIFSIATNDLFFRYQNFERNGHTYTVDRATSFEEQLVQNTGGLLNKSMDDYTDLEASAATPVLLITPTIINDGRRLLLSSSPFSYFEKENQFADNPTSELPEYVSLVSLLPPGEAPNLSMASALRMSATFPYVLPITSLPTDPKLGIMDAGLRDNYGIKAQLRFIQFFQQWLEENTSGVVLIQIRDTPKISGQKIKSPTLVSQFTAPLGSVYGNYFKMQDYENDQMLEFTKRSLSCRLDLVTFELPYSGDDNLSLSWHLTAAEKKRIAKALKTHKNEQSFSRIKELHALLP